MASGNLILGTMAGKLGDIVAYRYGGRQCARVRRRTIANPRSSKQAIQRAILATVGQFVNRFSPILNNSIQSAQSKVTTLAKIRSYNMNYLRQLAAQGLGFYNRKGSTYISPNDYIISRGDLQGINPLRSEAARLRLDDGYVSFPVSDVNVSDYSFTASQAFPSVAVGDQITILATYTSDFSRAATIVRYCRFAFKDDITPVFLEGVEHAILNPEAIDLTKADGDWRLLRFSDDAEGGVPFSVIDLSDFLGAAGRADMCGVIVSREADKMRSSASMVSAIFDDDPDYMIDGVYPTYMDGGTNIVMPSEVYLNNNASPSVISYPTGVHGHAISSLPVLPSSTFPIVVNTDDNAESVEGPGVIIGQIQGFLGGSHFVADIITSSIGSSIQATATITMGSVVTEVYCEGLHALGSTFTIAGPSTGSLQIDYINLVW